MENVWTYIVYPGVGALLTIITAWLTGFRKQKVEVKGIEIQNTGEEVKNKGLEIQNFKEYFETTNLMMSDLKNQIANLIETRAKERLEKDEHIGKLEAKIDQLTRSNRELVKKVSNLEQSICNECPKRQK
jgi:predicted RNase H-like nuclease (RuvC/YqgF family)